MDDEGFHLCDEGWRLYELWSALCEDKKTPARERTAAKRAYEAHRKTCAACSVWPEEEELNEM